jgi:hypothetical protein
MRSIMPLNITPDRFAAIRAKLMRRKAEALAAEIATTDWNNQPHFQSVDDFLNFADTFNEPPEAEAPGSQRRR